MPNRYYSSALLGSDEKSVFIHIVITLSVVHTNLCAPFKHLPLSLAAGSWIMMCEACFTWSVSSLVFLGHVWICMCASFTRLLASSHIMFNHLWPQSLCSWQVKGCDKHGECFCQVSQDLLNFHFIFPCSRCCLVSSALAVIGFSSVITILRPNPGQILDPVLCNF